MCHQTMLSTGELIRFERHRGIHIIIISLGYNLEGQQQNCLLLSVSCLQYSFLCCYFYFFVIGAVDINAVIKVFILVNKSGEVEFIVLLMMLYLVILPISTVF
jgi:hypothetical protein